MNGKSLTIPELLALVSRIKDLLISVSTGGQRIQDVNTEFEQDANVLDAELMLRRIQNPLAFTDLWVWHGIWSSGKLPTYASRRVHINGIFEQLIKQIKNPNVVSHERTGWVRVDRNADELRKRFTEAQTEEQYQAVGLLCREAVISTAQAVFKAELHPTVDGVKASDTDAKRMLEAYIPVALTGSANDFLRKHARASLDLAVHLQHRRTATFREAALCVEATTSVINIIAIVAGLRDPKQ